MIALFTITKNDLQIRKLAPGVLPKQWAEQYLERIYAIYRRATDQAHAEREKLYGLNVNDQTYTMVAELVGKHSQRC